MRFRKRVGLGYGKFWRGVIFDREYKNLDDLVAKSKRWFSLLDKDAKFLEAAKDYKWVWATGEELLFRVIKKEADYWNYHGQEFPFIGWNELTKYPTGKLYSDMLSCNRSSFTPEKDTPVHVSATGKIIGYNTPDGKLLPEIPLEIFSTSNPFGPGHAWVKRKFIDPVPYGHVQRTTTRVFNPRTQVEADIVKTQVAFFGSYKENIYLAPEYVAELENIKDPYKKKAWLQGDWNIVAGGAFDDLWSQDKHVVPRFKIPSNWYIDRSFDWGSSHPFSVGWWAESNGEEVILNDGTKRCFPKGSLFLVNEWYGAKELGTNEGLKLSAPDIAEGIKAKELVMIKEGWISKQPDAGPADNQIGDVRESDVDTIEKKMAKRGVHWQRSDKSKGSRIIGLQIFRDRLQASIRGEDPGVYFFDNCRAAISTIPVLPRDDVNIDDIDTEAEDHCWDMTRYRVLKGNNRQARQINVSFIT
jgi:hypothetical protein